MSKYPDIVIESFADTACHMQKMKQEIDEMKDSLKEYMQDAKEERKEIREALKTNFDLIQETRKMVLEDREAIRKMTDSEETKRTWINLVKENLIAIISLVASSGVIGLLLTKYFGG